MESVGIRAVTWNSEGNSLNYVQSGFSPKFNVLIKGNMAFGTARIVLLPYIDHVLKALEILRFYLLTEKKNHT